MYEVPKAQSKQYPIYWELLSTEQELMSTKWELLSIDRELLSTEWELMITKYRAT